jgi:hypothetical protein
VRSFLTLCCLVLGCANVAPAQERMFQFSLAGDKHEGTPLLYNAQQVIMLTRSGRILDFAPTAAQEYAPANTPFRSYGASELRGQLQREFGQGFEVSGRGRFLVVHPAGQQDVWAPRFEQLHRSFAHYFAARGWRADQPRFPLVAVVFPRQADFARYATAEGNHASSSMLGYYSPLSNRIVMYDTTATPGGDWTINAETIIHEALHQVAFNSGMHNRTGQTPRWVAEGLGTLFEARGVWNSQQFPAAVDRVNRGQLQAFRRYLPRRSKNAIAELVSADRAFEQDGQGAYAEAWALTFYLSETEPKKYFQYLQKTAAIPSFAPYPGPARLQDFTDVFGSNLPLLDARMQRYLAALP